MNNDKKILIGKIVAPQGIRGEVRIQTFTTTPLDFKDLAVFGDKIETKAFHFVRPVPNSNVIIARINGITDRNGAETLRGTELFVERNTLPNTKDGEYYQADLIGFDVVRDGHHIGTIQCFQNFGAGDIIEIENGDMFSFRGANVDFENKIVNI